MLLHSLNALEMELHGILAVLLPHFVWPSLAAQGSILDQLFGMSPLTGSATPMISPANLSAVFEAWPGYDVAVFYYSPYGEAGKYSSQVLPLWDQVWMRLTLLLWRLDIFVATGGSTAQSQKD